jgi:hypothetical protein
MMMHVNVALFILSGTETLLKDSYSVTVVATDLSRKCGMYGDSMLTLSSNGLIVTRTQNLGSVLEWKHISDVILVNESMDKNRICSLTMDRFVHFVILVVSGGGKLIIALF